MGAVVDIHMTDYNYVGLFPQVHVIVVNKMTQDLDTQKIISDDLIFNFMSETDVYPPRMIKVSKNIISYRFDTTNRARCEINYNYDTKTLDILRRYCDNYFVLQRTPTHLYHLTEKSLCIKNYANNTTRTWDIKTSHENVSLKNMHELVASKIVAEALDIDD
jgi:hypothetical protein